MVLFHFPNYEHQSVNQAIPAPQHFLYGNTRCESSVFFSMNTQTQ